MEEDDRLSDPPPICDKEEEQGSEDGESLSSTTTTTVKEESCNIKPLRPPVPPKPSKSKETSLGQILVVPLPEVLPCEDQNQSFKTDDEPAGDNLALESPSSISESFHLPQHTNNPSNGDESAVNPSQVSVIEEADSKSLSPNSIAEAINQGHLITAAPSNSTDTNVPTTIAPTTIAQCDCPYSQLHHQTPSELLSYPEILEQNDKSILFGIDDFSSKVEQKIGFIVQNLKDCGGIWPIMFLEKLNKIIVRCELSSLQLYFHENPGILSKLVESFDQERRCSMVFRYWCTFYNMIAREVVPCSTLASTSLVSVLQRDLILASSEVCSCSEVGGGAAAAVSKESFQYSDDKHPVIEFERQIEILAIIMIPLLTSRAETKSMKTSSCNDLDTSPDPKTFAKAIMTGMHIIAKEGRALEKISLNVVELQKPVENSNLLLGSIKSVSSVTRARKTTLINLLVACNMEYADDECNPIAEAIVQDDPHKRFIVDYVLTLLSKELKVLKDGNYRGIASLFPRAVGLQITGFRGPLKLLISLLKQDDSIFILHIVEILLYTIQEANEFLNQEEAKRGLGEKQHSQIVEECMQINTLLEARMAYILLHGVHDVAANCSSTLLSGGGDWKSSLNRRGSISSIASVSSFSHDSEGRGSTIGLSWALGDVLKNCFGCAKSKKKVQKSVCPANQEDIEEYNCMAE